MGAAIDMRRGFFGLLLILLAAMPALAEVPPEVRTRIAGLDQRCTAAGGRATTQSYVFVHDYDGDGRPDYLISEGNYGCAGKPGLFVQGGQALIEVYAARPGGGATSVYRAPVIGYRLLDRTPTLIQIAKAGPAACAGAARCGYDLVWNPAAGRLEDKPVGTAAKTTSAAPGPAIEPVVTGTLTPQTRAEALADCQADRRKAGMNAKAIPAECADAMKQLDAALPMARAIMALMTQPPAALRTPAGAKAALPTVKWSVRPMKPIPPMTAHEEGLLGAALHVVLEGRGGIDTVDFGWNQTGGLIPYDLPAALRFLGVRLIPIACGIGGDSFGDAATRSLRAELPGAAPFELQVSERMAAVAAQDSFFGAHIAFGKPVPSFASLRASSHSADPVEAVQWATCQP